MDGRSGTAGYPYGAALGQPEFSRPDGAETLAAWECFPMCRTDRNGWVEIETDGEHMWVEVESR